MTAPDGAEEAGEESPRGLIPKSLLMGKEFKPGDKIILKIEAIHGDEVEVSYPEEGADEPAADKAAAPPAGGGEMAPMME